MWQNVLFSLSDKVSENLNLYFQRQSQAVDSAHKSAKLTGALELYQVLMTRKSRTATKQDKPMMRHNLIVRLKGIMKFEIITDNFAPCSSETSNCENCDETSFSFTIAVAFLCCHDSRRHLLSPTSMHYAVYLPFQVLLTVAGLQEFSHSLHYLKFQATKSLGCKEM